jgi:hypothetical protein
MDWEELTMNFKVTFNFENDDHLIDSAFQVMKNNIFTLEDSIGFVPVYSMPIFFATIEGVLEFYNVAQED